MAVGARRIAIVAADDPVGEALLQALSAFPQAPGRSSPCDPDGQHFSVWLTYDHPGLEALQLRLGLEKLIESGLN